jgi:hypothetical protein
VKQRERALVRSVGLPLCGLEGVIGRMANSQGLLPGGGIGLSLGELESLLSRMVPFQGVTLEGVVGLPPGELRMLERVVRLVNDPASRVSLPLGEVEQLKMLLQMCRWGESSAGSAALGLRSTKKLEVIAKLQETPLSEWPSTGEAGAMEEGQVFLERSLKEGILQALPKVGLQSFPPGTKIVPLDLMQVVAGVGVGEMECWGHKRLPAEGGLMYRFRMESKGGRKGGVIQEIRRGKEWIHWEVIADVVCPGASVSVLFRETEGTVA